MLELTCGSCRNSPATHLVVADLDARRMVRAEQLTCKPCADRAAADARPGDWVRLYRLVPEDGSVTEWGVRYTDPDGSVREVPSANEVQARHWAAPDLDPWGPQVETALIQRQVGPWKEAPDE
jgi:hypothetical protein